MERRGTRRMYRGAHAEAVAPAWVCGRVYCFTQ